MGYEQNGVGDANLIYYWMMMVTCIEDLKTASIFRYWFAILIIDSTLPMLNRKNTWLQTSL